MANTTSIKITSETRANLIADLAQVPGTDHVTISDLMSRAQAFPERHLLDIMYQDGLKAAMKTLIAYYAVPVVNFDQEYPMHAGFFNVFHFCGKMIANSSYDASNVDETDLEVASSKISFHAAGMMISGTEKICSRNFKEKKDFLDLLNILRKNWSEDLFGSNIFWLLLSVLDFPAIEWADTPTARIHFAIWLQNLTAYWPETIWNWNDFSC